MNKKLKLVLIVLMSLIIVATIVIFAVVYFTKERIDGTNTNSATNINATTNSNANTNQAVNTNGNANSNSAPSNTNSPTSDVNASVETLLKPIARNFAERFGSYSSDSNFENITKLGIYMSTSLKKWAENYVAEQQAKTSPDDAYYGVTTRALSITTDLINEDAGKAEFTVSTQRNQTKLNEDSEIIYQNIKLKFILENNEWKVNEADWL
ncbi:MAG: hypothetical protein WC693_04640 [Patescibacteria group bacterium]|jgi:hypothetical protein